MPIKSISPTMDPAVHLPAKRLADHPTHTDPTPHKQPRTGVKKKVAEIVLFLSAMAEMRGGMSPTQPELDLMAEARAKLVDVCESTMTPKDLVRKEAVEALIDDLGLLQKIKERDVIVGPPKLSISDKLLQTQKKMEEEAKQLEAKLAISRSAAAASSIGNVHGSISGSSAYPLNPNNEKPRAISGVLNNNAGKTSSFSLPGAVKPHYGGPRPVSAGSSFDHGQRNTSTWSVQPQTLSFSRYGNDKVSAASRNEEAYRVMPQAIRDQSHRTLGSHIPTHQSLPEAATGQGAPLVSNHYEISKTVNSLLQKQVIERPTWTPPSRDYMNKAVMCQVCHNSVSDVESVFLCDACEHAYHFRCLPSSNQKVVPRGEWHCPKCLQQSNGKPLPPKYGRVTRNVTTSKAPSKVAGFQTSSDQKANMQKVRAVDPQAIITGSIASSINIPERRQLQVSATTAKSYSEASFVKNLNHSGVNSGSLRGQIDGNSAQGLKVSSLQGHPVADAKPRLAVQKIDIVPNSLEGEQASLSSGEQFAKLYDTIPNMPGGSSARNDLLNPDSVAKLSALDTSSSSQQSSINMPKPVSTLPESDTHMLGQASANIASATQLTDMSTETSEREPNQKELLTSNVKRDLAGIAASSTRLTNVATETKPDRNELSSYKVDTAMASVPGANTSEIVDHFSGPSEDQLK